MSATLIIYAKLATPAAFLKIKVFWKEQPVSSTKFDHLTQITEVMSPK